MAFHYIASAAALLAATATPALAQTVTPTNGNLATKIMADDYNDGNPNIVFGTTGTAPSNVSFTGNTAISITGGSGFAQINDADVPGGTKDFFSLIIDPLEGFSQYEFSLQMDQTSSFRVAYSLGGGAFTNIGGAILQQANANTNYLVDSGGLVFDALRITSSWSPINQVKQNSITLVSNVPEPATWAMMLLGFGAVGFQVRRRRQQLQVTYA